MNSVKLTPVAALKGYWRVKMTWPNKNLHFFGKFLSRAEAEKWIERHRATGARKGRRPRMLTKYAECCSEAAN